MKPPWAKTQRRPRRAKRNGNGKRTHGEQECTSLAPTSEEEAETIETWEEEEEEEEI